jgi:hypothetical protein
LKILNERRRRRRAEIGDEDFDDIGGAGRRRDALRQARVGVHRTELGDVAAREDVVAAGDAEIDRIADQPPSREVARLEAAVDDDFGERLRLAGKQRQETENAKDASAALGSTATAARR